MAEDCNKTNNCNCNNPDDELTHIYERKTAAALNFYRPYLRVHGINLECEDEVKVYLETIYERSMNDQLYNCLDYELLVFLEIYYKNSETISGIIRNMKELSFKNYYEKLQMINRIGMNHNTYYNSDSYLKDFNAIPKSNAKIRTFYYREMEGLRGSLQRTNDNNIKFDNHIVIRKPEGEK